MNTETSKTDPRFKIAHREAWIGVGLAIFNFIWWFGFAYGLGSRPVEAYTYIFGLPDWFFYSCVVGFLLMSALVIVIAKYVLTEVSFDEEVEE
ncbi:YhdT family protein [Sporosarcina ureilytica]|uniref:Sodium:pantothenate symporter n=1 Tax=Sporosarcina ureilytica TaxID=298596 RepID=A0A1D8JJC4_9BACL|nr:YhdT family protein [Sporosarcina ureilytica]AOV08802.1 sodium:pantothenate symporter [Sporosarcina ureilytica]